MAEGVADEDGSDVMLVTSLANGGCAEIKREPDAPAQLKSEESCDSEYPSPEPASSMGVDCTSHAQRTHAPTFTQSTPGTPNHNHSGPSSPEGHQTMGNGHIPHLSLQGLQQLAALQSMPALPALATLGANFLNAPLNLSANATGAHLPGHTVGNLLNAAPTQPIGPTAPFSLPQLILASGQMVQGIQGAQLLIPTSQGIATQTILTIPVDHVTGSQVVNLSLSNGQVLATTLANLQSMTQGCQPLPNHTNTAPCQVPNSAVLSPAVEQNVHQQLLATLQQSQLQQQQAGVQHRPTQQHQQHQQHHMAASHAGHYQPPEKCAVNGLCLSEPNESSLNVISRLAASNTDVTITTTNQKSASYASTNGSQPSPGSDFMADSPGQPTINQTSGNVVDGINLDDIKEFAKAFKLRRLSLGLTQTQVGQALSITEGPAYSQSAICSALAAQVYCAQLASQHQTMFEKLDITPKSAQKIKPVLEMWMKEAEERYKVGQNHLTDFIGVEPSKKRKRRTSFTPQALELLNAHFERNTHPSGTEITALGHQLGYDREVIRIWFCNKRQALKNTVRMMSKGMM